MFSIEEIESIMDDTAEAVEKQREIDALLSGQGRFLAIFATSNSYNIFENKLKTPSRGKRHLCCHFYCPICPWYLPV